MPTFSLSSSPFRTPTPRSPSALTASASNGRLCHGRQSASPFYPHRRAERDVEGLVVELGAGREERFGIRAGRPTELILFRLDGIGDGTRDRSGDVNCSRGRLFRVAASRSPTLSSSRSPSRSAQPAQRPKRCWRSCRDHARASSGRMLQSSAGPFEQPVMRMRDMRGSFSSNQRASAAPASFGSVRNRPSHVVVDTRSRKRS
jgi:hypothetical protein